MNRGSPRERHSFRCNRPGFNEAPIHESGKYTRPGRPPCGRNSFNEAPIHESGKYAVGMSEDATDALLQ